MFMYSLVQHLPKRWYTFQGRKVRPTVCSVVKLNFFRIMANISNRSEVFRWKKAIMKWYSLAIEKTLRYKKIIKTHKQTSYSNMKLSTFALYQKKFSTAFFLLDFIVLSVWYQLIRMARSHHLLSTRIFWTLRVKNWLVMIFWGQLHQSDEIDQTCHSIPLKLIFWILLLQHKILQKPNYLLYFNGSRDTNNNSEIFGPISKIKEANLI